MLAGFQAFDHLIVLWVLAADADLALGGLAAILAYHVYPLAAGLLEEGSARMSTASSGEPSWRLR